MFTGSLRSLFLLAALALGGCAVESVGAEEQGETSSEITDVATTVPETDAVAATEGLALSPHTTLGLPEAATPTDPVHALIVKSQYVTSYDSTKKNPRWVSWELTPKWLGSADRSDSWSTDRDLATGIPQAVNSDFTNSGFQRGHLCPSADRTKNDSDNRSTFVFTNAVPQTGESNGSTWLSLEYEERALAKVTNNHVFVVAGSIYEGTPKKIGNGVRVPSSMFKIVVVMQGARPLPSEVTAATRVIAVEIPNTTTVSGNFRRYRTSIEAIEQKTGFHLLSDVDPAVHAALAPQVDSQ